jgi:pyruvate formate lyase activating enzyme
MKSKYPPIVGFKPISVLDYPKHISSIIYTFGCNFNCPYCHNKPCLVKISDFFPEDIVIEKIKERIGFIDGVVITGGEPLVYEETGNLIKCIKNLGLKVKLDTNGSFPGRLEKVIDYVDYVAMDIKTSLEKYKLLTGVEDIEDKILKSIKIIMEKAKDYEFRTTVAPKIVEFEDIEKIGGLIKGSKILYIQQFVNENCVSEEFRSLEPYSLEDLEKMKKILEGYVEKVEIRTV